MTMVLGALAEMCCGLLSASQQLPMQEFQYKVIFGSFLVADSESSLFKCRNSAGTLIARPQWASYFPFPFPHIVSLSLLCGNGELT